MNSEPTSREYVTWEEAVIWLKRQPNTLDLLRACYFDDPLPAAAHRYYMSSEWQAIRRWLPSFRGRALDIGAGMGITSYALARDGWRVVALEPDDSPIVGAAAISSLARETKAMIAVARTRGEQLPFENDTFDLVHCRQVLHHAHNLAQLCQQVGRVLKSGGLFVATREHVISRAEDLPVFRANHPLHHLYGGESAYLLSDYVKAIQNGGITLARILNPYASDINLFPDTMASLKRRIAERLHWPWPALIPDVLLVWLGDRCQTPGRLYSFVGRKVCGN